MNMKQFAAISAINARVNACMAEMQAFTTLNVERESQGKSLAYGEDVFHAVAHNIRAFAHELDDLVKECNTKAFLDDVCMAEELEKALVADSDEYEIEVRCGCGCRDTISFSRPDCSGGCGRPMYPTRVWTLKDLIANARHALDRVSGASKTEDLES